VGRATDDVYAVGFRGIVLHWNGGAWSVVTTPNINDRQLFTVHGNASGSAPSAASSSKACCSSAKARGISSSPARPPARSSTASSTRRMRRPSPSATASRSPPATTGGWTTVDEGNDDQGRDFHAVWVDSEDGIWAVGGDLADLVNGVLRYGGPQFVPGTLR
jgi:hypothetical protein